MKAITCRNQINNRSLILIFLVFISVHIPLFVHDVTYSDNFFSGDRHASRLKKIEYVFNGREGPYIGRLLSQADLKPSSFGERMILIPGAGDYFFHGVLMEFGGRPLVLLVQIGMALVAALCVYRLCLLLGLRDGFALVATLIYLLLPGTLGNAHQLVTEGLFNPLLVVAVYFLVRNCQEPIHYQTLLIALFAIACAIFLRPQLLLFPFVVAAIFAFSDRDNGLKNTLIVLGIGVGLPSIWLLAQYAVKGSFALGSLDYSLAHNFYLRVSRMSAVGGFPFDGSFYELKQMPIWDFLTIVFAHPVAYLKTILSDFINIVVNPGTKWFAVDYLRIIEFSEDVSYWANLRDEEGLLAVALDIFRWGPAFAISFYGGMLLWAVILVGATIGTVWFLADPRASNASKALLLGFVVYEIAVSLASGGLPRWTYRTPFEFVMAIMVAFGLEWLSRRLIIWRFTRVR